MKQGKIYNKLIMLAILLAILSYLGYAVISALRHPLTTVLAIEYEAGAGCHTTGFVVRDETVLTSQYPITVLDRKEGEKVGIGQTVATGYRSADAQERQSKIESLNAQISQLDYAYSYNLDVADTAGLDTEILTQLTECAQSVARRELSSVADLSAELKGLILRRSTDAADLASIQAQKAALQSQLQQLQTISGADTSQITAPASGYFSGTVDGYESVLTSACLNALDVAGYDTLAAQSVPQDACGRLISSATWYYVTTAPTESLKGVAVGNRVSLSFSHDFYNTLQMQVVRISDPSDGRQLLVLRSSQYIQNVTLLRQQTADVVFSSYAGLRVPKDALRLDADNKPGVYVLESTSAKWKPVTILYDNGESYVVRLDRSDTANLWPGDEIIVEAKDLYDGKVVNLQ